MIRAVYESGYGQTAYNIFIILCLVGVIAFNVWYSSKYGITKRKAFISSVYIFAVIYAWIYFLSWAESGFKIFGGKNLVRGFVYIPVFAYPMARLLKIEWHRMCDFLAPCGSLAQGINKIGCMFAGCCHGYPWKYGIYCPDTGGRAFPCQPVESIIYLTIVVLVVLYAKRKKYVPGGSSFALMLILFGTSRFLLEFARDEAKLFLGCSSLSFHSLFMVIVGTIAALYIAEKNIRSQKGKPLRKQKNR